MELVWDGFGPPRFQVFEPAARDVWCGLINHARSLPRLGSTRRARELSYRSERPSNLRPGLGYHPFSRTLSADP